MLISDSFRVRYCTEVFWMKMDVSELSYSQIQRIAESLPLAIEQISIRGNRVSLVVGDSVC